MDEKKITLKPLEVNKSYLKKLKEQKITQIELDVQSTNEYILNKIGEKYTVKDIRKASRLVRFYRFSLGFKITIGLYESTKIDDLNTAKTLIKFKPKFVNINPVIIEKGTKIEKEFQKQNYKPLTVVQAIEICKDIVKIFKKKNIESILDGFEVTNTEITEGPYHNAFREIVETGLWYDAIVEKIKQLNTKVMQVEVTVNPDDVNNVIGYKNENIEKLKEMYDLDLIVTPNEEIKQGKSKIEVTKTYKDFME